MGQHKNAKAQAGRVATAYGVLIEGSRRKPKEIISMPNQQMTPEQAERIRKVKE